MLVLRIRQLKTTKKAPLLQGVPNHLKMIYLSGYLGFLSYHHHSTSWKVSELDEMAPEVWLCSYKLVMVNGIVLQSQKL